MVIDLVTPEGSRSPSPAPVPAASPAALPDFVQTGLSRAVWAAASPAASPVASRAASPRVEWQDAPRAASPDALPRAASPCAALPAALSADTAAKTSKKGSHQGDNDEDVAMSSSTASLADADAKPAKKKRRVQAREEAKRPRSNGLTEIPNCTFQGVSLSFLPEVTRGLILRMREQYKDLQKLRRRYYNMHNTSTKRGKPNIPGRVQPTNLPTEVITGIEALDHDALGRIQTWMSSETTRLNDAIEAMGGRVNQRQAGCDRSPSPEPSVNARGSSPSPMPLPRRARSITPAHCEGRPSPSPMGLAQSPLPRRERSRSLTPAYHAAPTSPSYRRVDVASSSTSSLYVPTDQQKEERKCCLCFDTLGESEGVGCNYEETEQKEEHFYCNNCIVEHVRSCCSNGSMAKEIHGRDNVLVSGAGQLPCAYVTTGECRNGSMSSDRLDEIVVKRDGMLYVVFCNIRLEHAVAWKEHRDTVHAHKEKLRLARLPVTDKVAMKVNLAVTEGQIVRCPSCDVGIEKESGCMHMDCVCGTKFCYACGCDRYKNYPPNKAFVSHVNKVPCACDYSSCFIRTINGRYIPGDVAVEFHRLKVARFLRLVKQQVGYVAWESFRKKNPERFRNVIKGKDIAWIEINLARFPTVFPDNGDAHMRAKSVASIANMEESFMEKVRAMD